MYIEVEDKAMEVYSYLDFVEGQRVAFKTFFSMVRESLGVCAERRKKKYDMICLLHIKWEIGCIIPAPGIGWADRPSGKISIQDHT